MQITDKKQWESLFSKIVASPASLWQTNRPVSIEVAHDDLEKMQTLKMYIYTPLSLMTRCKKIIFKGMRFFHRFRMNLNPGFPHTFGDPI